MHLFRFSRNAGAGTLIAATAKVTVTEDTDNCIEADLPTTKGYGYVSVNGVTIKAHRLAYVVANGLKLMDIDGKVIMHKCDNRLCINPKHLTVGTVADNNADREAKGRSYTRKGNEVNTSKLTAEQVLEIRALTKGTCASIAAKYNVSANAIWAIRSRKTWTHI